MGARWFDRANTALFKGFGECFEGFEGGFEETRLSRSSKSSTGVFLAPALRFAPASDAAPAARVSAKVSPSRSVVAEVALAPAFARIDAETFDRLERAFARREVSAEGGVHGGVYASGGGAADEGERPAPPPRDGSRSRVAASLNACSDIS